MLLLAGCTLPAPAPAKHAMTLRDGPWTLEVSWDDLSGAPGDEVAFRLRARTDAPNGTYWLSTNASGLKVGNGRPPPIEGREATYEGRALVGLARRLSFVLVSQNETYSFEGPPVEVREGIRSTPVEVRRLDDVADVPGGLSAERQNGSVVVTFASPAVVESACDTAVGTAGEWLLVERDGAPARLVAFVVRMSSDACALEPPTRPRLVATLRDAPDPLEVVAVGHVSCFCFEVPWFRETVTA